MVGTVLQSIRHQRNMTQEELASKAKVDRTYISLLEHNKKSPTVDMLFRLCRALGVRPSVVIARTEKAQSTK
ncbi:MAG: helix-turn-helix transcriptional regulator [Gemmatales bacterium]